MDALLDSCTISVCVCVHPNQQCSPYATNYGCAKRMLHPGSSATFPETLLSSHQQVLDGSENAQQKGGSAGVWHARLHAAMRTRPLQTKGPPWRQRLPWRCIGLLSSLVVMSNTLRPRGDRHSPTHVGKRSHAHSTDAHPAGHDHDLLARNSRPRHRPREQCLLGFYCVRF